MYLPDPALRSCLWRKPRAFSGMADVPKTVWPAVRNAADESVPGFQADLEGREIQHGGAGASDGPHGRGTEVKLRFEARLAHLFDPATERNLLV